MKNAAGTEGQGHGERREADVLFPSEGNFSTVVPLSQSGGKSAGTAPGGLEEEEATLVPRRGRRRRGTRPAPASLARQGFEHSLAFLAAAVVLSLAAGAVAGVYMLRWQHPAEAYKAEPPAVESVAAGEAAATAEVAAPAAQPPAPQTPPPAPPPQNERDRLAAVPSVRPVEPAEPAEVETKVRRVNTSARTEKAPLQEAEPTARRAAKTEPRAAQPARAAVEAQPAPRPTRAAAAAPRRKESDAPSTANTPSRRPSLVSSPPPSAKPRKVIQWP